MASAGEMRQFVERTATQIEFLRQFDDLIGPSLNDAVGRFNRLKAGMPRDVLGEATDNWEARPEAEREELHQRLKEIAAALDALETRARFPGFWARLCLLAYGVVVPVALLVPVFLAICMGALPDAGQGASPTLHPAWMWLLILCMGALGGSLRLISSLVLYLGKRKLYRSWLPFYYLAPLEGALIALIVGVLIVGGVFQLESSDPSKSAMLSLYALAGLSGLFAKNVLRKLRDLADVLFAKPSETDAA
jgi:hypothetical protein